MHTHTYISIFDPVCLLTEKLSKHGSTLATLAGRSFVLHLLLPACVLLLTEVKLYSLVVTQQAPNNIAQELEGEKERITKIRAFV